MSPLVSTSSVFARLALLVYLVAGLFPAGRFVICIEGSGSIAIESVSEADACTDCSVPSPCSEDEDDPPGDECGCIDVVISQPEQNRVVPGTSVQVAESHADAVAPSHFEAWSLRSHGTLRAPHARHEESRSPGHLDALRITVLRL